MPVDSGGIFIFCPSNPKPAPKLLLCVSKSKDQLQINAIGFSRCMSLLKTMWQQFFLGRGGRGGTTRDTKEGARWTTQRWGLWDPCESSGWGGVGPNLHSLELQSCIVSTSQASINCGILSGDVPDSAHISSSEQTHFCFYFMGPPPLPPTLQWENSAAFSAFERITCSRDTNS